MLHFSNHARDRMRERNISEEEVSECLQNPDTTYPDEDDDNMNYVCTLSSGRKIRVVINEKRPRHRVIISVMD